MHCGGHLPGNVIAAVGAMQSGQWWLATPLEDRHHSSP